MLRKFSADYIFPVSSPPIKNGEVVTDDTGKILEVASPPLQMERGLGGEVEYLDGIIIPGFINSHCHLDDVGCRI